MKSNDICRSCEESGQNGDLPHRIAGWISACVRIAGMRGAVLGLSGGIDSAVVAGLCAMALNDNVLGVIMPCGSANEDERDALIAAARFGVRTETVRLDGPLKAMLEVLPGAPDIAPANLKPRLRMAALYYWANKLSYIVVGTGNRSELMAGYFTKHGDGGVDLLPLGSLYKGEVRKLAMEIGVPERIISKPPSAGLWMGQTDEGEMGMSYNELDSALDAIESGRMNGVPTELLERVSRMKAASAHKRHLPLIFEDV